jgi:hypothetical protein
MDTGQILSLCVSMFAASLAIHRGVGDSMWCISARHAPSQSDHVMRTYRDIPHPMS